MDINTCLETAIDYRTIAYYTHLVPFFLTILLIAFTLVKSRNAFQVKVFSFFAIAFCAWLLGDLIAWTTNDYNLVNLAWAPLDYFNVIFYLLGAYFYFVLVNGKDISSKWKFLLFLLTLPAWWITVSNQSISAFYLPVCEALNSDPLSNYKLVIEGVAVFFIIFASFFEWRKSDREKKKQILTVSFALILFFATFSVTEYISSVTGVYEINLYSLFVLPVFLFIIIYSITNLEIFDTHLIGSQLLAYTLVIMVGSQFFFLTDATDRTLTVVTFLLSLGFAMLLIRSAKREADARLRVEQLAKDLQVANDQQSILIHFITHQIKGFFTMSRNIFSLMLENTFGELNPDMKRMVQQGFDNTTKGVKTVQEILNAANLKKGTVRMNMADFDLRALVDEVLDEAKPRLEAKGLQFSTVLSSGPIMVNADRLHLHEVFKNLLDNAIRYTLKGNVNVKFEKKDGIAHFEVKDSGIGLSDEDKARLFTEGGRGKDSLRVNVDSTGYGLFIAKNIVLAHKGKIWADSKGKDQGSTFNVEIPILG